MSEVAQTPAKNRQSTMKNTLKSMLVLTVIAVVCVAILAVANHFMQPEIRLDAQTCALINRIAPTGESDADALSSGSIKMVDLSKGGYKITDLAAYNKSYGSASQKIRALYTSRNKTTGKTTSVVEAESKGHVDAVVVLVAYDDDLTITGIVVKSHSESYWDKVKEEQLYKAIVGSSGQITASSAVIAASTGATHTRDAIVNAVNLASGFMVRLGKEEKPETVTDASELNKLAYLSEATSFTRYPMQEGKTAYLGDNGDLIVKATGGESLSYGKVTLFVLVKDGTVVKVAYDSSGFTPTEDYDSDKLQNSETLTAMFAGKTKEDIAGMSGKLPGITGATQSSTGVREAVLAALDYASKFDASAWEA